MENVTVFSLGGSIVAPDGVDHAFVRAFVETMTKRLDEKPKWRLGLVVGGGTLARQYQDSLRKIDPAVSDDALDALGIAATRVNAALVRGAWSSSPGGGSRDSPPTTWQCTWQSLSALRR